MNDPMPTRTRLATVVVALVATAIGFTTPAGSVGAPEGLAGDTARATAGSGHP